jgi:DNA polymerase elongation subunit (family B)
MYQNIFFERSTNTCHLWDDKKGYTSFAFRPYAYRKRNGGKYKSMFGDELEKIYSFNPRDPSLFESDVPIDTRILIDAYEDSDEPSEGHRVLFLDIEVSTEGGFAKDDEADKEITAIAIYDALTKKYTAFILDRNGLMENFDSDEKAILSYRTEEDMLMAFLSKWEEIQPTITTGWNSNQFDMPYIYRRLKNVVGAQNAKRLSPIGISYINDWNKRLVIGGVTHLDYMKVYEKLMIKKEASYSLNAIGKKQVGMEKITYRGSLDTLYKEDIKKYVEYNLNDVQIMVALDDKLKLIELVRAICHKGHVPYECYDRSSRFIEGAILMYLRRNGRVAKNKPVDGREEYENQQENDEEGFEGAYVKEPVPGRYEWVFDLDLTSMYPNIVISLNISPETKVGVIDRIEFDDVHIVERKKELTDDWENLSDKTKKETPLEQYIEQRLYNYNARMFAQGKIAKYHLGSACYTHESFMNLLTQSNLSVSGNGVLYQKEVAGVLPNILVKWFDERKEMRDLAKKYAKEKNWEQYEFYEQRQKVQKVLLNSIYGVLGLAIFRFYDKDNASAVTITGQDIIKTTGKAINEYFKKALNVNDGNYVIYTDTDSCFASALPIIQKNTPDIDLNDETQMTDAIMKVTTEVQTFVNKFYDKMALRLFNIETHRFEAKQEVIAKTSFWLTKKRYAQFIINVAGLDVKTMEVTHENRNEFVFDEKGNHIAKLEVKGIDVVKSSFPVYFRTFMEKFLQDILLKTEKEVIDGNILSMLDDLGNTDIISVAKNTSVKFKSKDGKNDFNPKTRHPFKYVKGTTAQAKAALAYNDLLKYYGIETMVQPIFHGQKIKWVYLKKNDLGLDCVALKADGTDPDQVLDFINKYVDRTAMYEQELQGKLSDFYNILKWTYPNGTDATVDEFFGF